MKTTPFKHQPIGVAHMAANEVFGLGAEQGTGKTWMLLADAEQRFESGQIDALVVIAPKGVHTNWVLREAPVHLSVPYEARFWLSGAGVKFERDVQKFIDTPMPGKLKLFAMNYNAVITKKGKPALERFLSSHRCAFVLDESHFIKNPKGKTNQVLVELRDLAPVRRLASGTLIPDSPLDLYGQFKFLGDGLLGTKSYRAFVSEYAEILPRWHPLVQEILAKSRGRGDPQVQARDKDGNLIFRNLDKLRGLLKPHIYRVLKKDCLDLPPKIYQTHYFEMTPAQAKLYREVKETYRYELEGGDVEEYTPLTLSTKLRQVTSGFLNVQGEPQNLVNDEPRIALLKTLIETHDVPTIIWCCYVEEIHRVCAMLDEAGKSFSTYYGATSTEDRELAVDNFQAGKIQFFVANRSASTGLTLTQAEHVIFYGMSFSLQERLQQEDRSHRIGTKGSVVYSDVVARGTIDEKVIKDVQQKGFVANNVLDG